MSYRNYYTPNTYSPQYQHRYKYSNISKNYSQRDEINNAQQIEWMLQQQRKKFREAKQTYQYDLQNERKIRIEFQNKLIKLKNEFSRKQITISQMQFKINNLLQQNQCFIQQSQRLKAEIHRMQEVYECKINQLQTQLDMETRSFEETTLQYNSQFDKFKKQGQEYVQQLTFQFERKIRNLQQKLKGSETSKRELSLEVKKLNDILISNKLNFEEQLRDIKNRIRDDEMRKNSNLSKSFEGKLKMIEESKQVLVRKNRQLLKSLQDKERKLEKFQNELKQQSDRARHQNTQLLQQINSMNYLIGKLKSEIAEKDSMLGRKGNDNEEQMIMLRNQLAVKSNEINRISSINKQLRINLKEMQNSQERVRRELVQKCNMWEGEARKYKDEYKRICEVLKSKINDTINNVGRNR